MIPSSARSENKPKYRKGIPTIWKIKILRLRKPRMFTAKILPNVIREMNTQIAINTIKKNQKYYIVNNHLVTLNNQIFILLI